MYLYLYLCLYLCSVVQRVKARRWRCQRFSRDYSNGGNTCAQSHSVIYRPTSHIWRHIYKHMIICRLLLYCWLTNSLVRRPFGFHGQCARKPLLHVLSHICVSTCHEYVHINHYCTYFHKYVCHIVMAESVHHVHTP